MKDEIEALLHLIRVQNLEFVEGIAHNHEKGYTDADLKKLAIFAGAIAGIEDALALGEEDGFLPAQPAGTFLLPDKGDQGES